ncbi:unnamed protein product [Dicrocoelium dendriticum]|nr:unnamed protein product [Dicrocoelium dendriticum]
MPSPLVFTAKLLVSSFCSPPPFIGYYTSYKFSFCCLVPRTANRLLSKIVQSTTFAARTFFYQLVRIWIASHKLLPVVSSRIRNEQRTLRLNFYAVAKIVRQIDLGFFEDI